MPAALPIISAALPIVSGIVGSIAGKGKAGKAQANVPQDLQGLRGQSINFLSSIMANPANLEKFFGPLVSGQQNEASGILSGIGQDNGQNVINALAPQYQRNLSAANQSGGRFGSANALMRASAANDFNMLSAQIANQAQDRRMNAANSLAQLGQQMTQNRVGLLNQLMSTSMQAGLNQPTTVSPTMGQQGATFGQGLGSILDQLAPVLRGGGGGGGQSGVVEGFANPVNRIGFGGQS